jgi:hypothetical protein
MTTEVASVRIRSTFRRDSLGAALALAAIALTFLLAACGGNKTATTKPPAGGSAKGGLAAAQSALSTMAPDAKLLLVQTAQSVAVTDTPVWVYVFGSPKTDKTYLVYERAG